MDKVKRSHRRPAAPPAPDRIFRAATTVGLLCSLATLVAPSVARSQTRYRSDCEVIETTRLENFGHDGRPAQLSHFVCHITGGPMDGSSVTGTNIWDLPGDSGGAMMLLGSIAIAQRAGANVMYEVHDADRQTQTHEGKVVGWTSSSWGVYKSATGSAAHLLGKTFTSVAHQTGSRTFVIDNIINED